MNRTHGSCRESWDWKMLRHESKDMDLAEDPEIYRCWDMNLAEDPEIHMDADLRIRRHGSSRGPWGIKTLRHESETWILQRILRYIWIIWMLRHESGDMDLAEEPEIHMDAYLRIRRHGSCRGAWDTYECLFTDPETWILQRFLRYIWMLRHESEDMDLAEDPEV